MGISQHVHGTDNARCLIALALVTGQVGRPGTGPASAARPEQRAGRVRRRPHPDVLSRLPVGRGSRDPRASTRSSGAPPLDPKRGLTVVEIMNAIHADEIRGMYIMGENPAMSDPDVAARARGAGQARASRGAGHLPHRDRALCRRGAAGLGLAGEDRHLHQHQPPGADGPRGAAAAGRGARRICWIIQEIARRLGLDWNYAHPARRLRRDEARRCRRSTTSPGSGSSARARSPIPATPPDKPGNEIVFGDGFPTQDRPRQARAGRPGAAGRGARRRLSRWCSRPAASSSIGTPAP